MRVTATKTYQLPAYQPHEGRRCLMIDSRAWCFLGVVTDMNMVIHPKYSKRFCEWILHLILPCSSDFSYVVV